MRSHPLVLTASLALAAQGCDAAATSIEGQVASDAVAQYEIVKRGGDRIQACVHAGLVTAAFLQAQDEASYRKWAEIEKRECAAAGVPQ